PFADLNGRQPGTPAISPRRKRWIVAGLQPIWTAASPSSSQVRCSGGGMGLRDLAFFICLAPKSAAPSRQIVIRRLSSISLDAPDRHVPDAAIDLGFDLPYVLANHRSSSLKRRPMASAGASSLPERTAHNGGHSRCRSFPAGL